MDTLNPEDLMRIEESFQQALQGTDQACTGGIADVHAHQDVIEAALGAIESEVTYFDKLSKHYQGLTAEAKDKKRKLERCFDRCQRYYWTLREAQKRNPSA